MPQPKEVEIGGNLGCVLMILIMGIIFLGFVALTSH